MDDKAKETIAPDDAGDFSSKPAQPAKSPIPATVDLQPPVDPMSTAIPPTRAGDSISDSVLDALQVELKHLPRARLPEKIDRYHIIRLLGEGGMGAVYQAEQRVPIRRSVAVKVVRAGHETSHILDRFNSERQALARMDHPGIAKVLDAGTTEDGQPFFVMDFVAGEPITEFADKHQLTIEQRLKLFIQVCQAIGHAHSKALLHRDIKSQNVLAAFVDGEPSIKVIDFGIAKAVGDEKISSAELTMGPHMVVGTLYVMSPEQLDGSSDIDTRTDVYALGVLLYELLGGRLPFELEEFATRTIHEARSLVQTKHPPRLSDWLGREEKRGEQIARDRKTSLPALTRTLRNELEWIPLKALRKDRERRYESALQFAADCQNYLTGRPLIAGPESRAYIFRKFVSRNRLPLGVAVAVVSLIVAGTIAYTVSIQRAYRKVDYANNTAQDVVNFSKNVFAQASYSEFGTDVSLKRALEEATRHAQEKGWPDDPLRRADLQMQIGVALRDAGSYGLAEAQLSEAIDIAAKALPPDDPRLATGYSRLGLLKKNRGDLTSAEALYRKAIAIHRVNSPQGSYELAETVNNLGSCLLRKGDVSGAREQFSEALQMLSAMKDVDLLKAVCLSNLGGVAEAEKRYDDALALHQEALSIRKRILEPQASATAESLMNIGNVFSAKKQFDLAVPMIEEALGAYIARAGDTHPQTMRCRLVYAAALRGVNRLDDAIVQYQLCIDGMTKRPGEMDKELAAARSGLGRTLLMTPGRESEAEAPLLLSLEYRLASNDPNLQVTVDTLIGLYRKTGEQEKLGALEHRISTLKSIGKP